MTSPVTDARNGIKRALAGAVEAKRKDDKGHPSPLAPFLADYERRATDWRLVLKANTKARRLSDDQRNLDPH